jgi:membrane protease YdiL (CAAX protease family)
MKTEQQAGSNAIKEVFVFFAITLGLVYFVLWGPMVFFQIPASSFVSDVKSPAWSLAFLFLGGFTPSLVALGLTWRKEGRVGLKQMWQRTIHFRIGWRWYIASIALVVFASACQILFIYLLGGSFDFSLFLTQLPSALFLIMIGPLSEELGWRGYAQTKLQTRWNPLVAGVVVGMFWALWHLPLFLWPGTSQYVLKIPFIGFLCGVTALSVLFAWLHNHTNGMIWTAVFFHWIYTYAAQVVASGVTRNALYNWLEYLPYILAALVIAAVWIREMRSKSPGPVEAKMGVGESV